MSLRYDAFKIVIMTRMSPCSGSAARCIMISQLACQRGVVNGR
jgi:hypothetical protein